MSQRYRGILIDLDHVDSGLYYLARIVPKRGSERYTVRDTPCRTNQSNAERLHGWCGTTNGTAVYAEGCVRVTYYGPNEVRVSPVSDQAMFESEECSA